MEDIPGQAGDNFLDNVPVGYHFSHSFGAFWSRATMGNAANWTVVYLCCLSAVGIVMLDWMRYVVEGGEKPHYT